MYGRRYKKSSVGRRYRKYNRSVRTVKRIRRRPRYVNTRKRSTKSIVSGIVPDRLMTKFKYEQRVALASAAGIQASQVFRGNSLFDPDFTGTGSQPIGYDQWANFYKSYRVYGSKISIKFATVGTTAGSQAFDLVVYPSLDSTLVNQDAAHVQPLAKYKVTNLSNQPVSINSYCSTSKMYGTVKTAIPIDDNFAAVIGANPTNVWFWNMAIQPIDQSTSGTVIAYVKITYYAELYNKIALNLS